MSGTLCLSLFEYTLQFKRILAHSNADALSHLPLPIESAIATVSYFQNKTTRDYEESHCSTAMLMELCIKHKKLITASEFKVLYVQLKVYVFGDDGLP